MSQLMKQTARIITRGAALIAALKSGILILVAPPMLICLCIAWMAYKKRNQFNEE